MESYLRILRRLRNKFRKQRSLTYSPNLNKEENEEFEELFYKSIGGLSKEEHARFNLLSEKAL